MVQFQDVQGGEIVALLKEDPDKDLRSFDLTRLSDDQSFELFASETSRTIRFDGKEEFLIQAEHDQACEDSIRWARKHTWKEILETDDRAWRQWGREAGYIDFLAQGLPLRDHEIANSLSAQPQFVNYFSSDSLRELSRCEVASLLSTQPQFHSLLSTSILKPDHIAEILRWQPQLDCMFDLEQIAEISGSALYVLLYHHSQFAETCKRNIPSMCLPKIRYLLSEHPAMARYVTLDQLEELGLKKLILPEL